MADNIAVWVQVVHQNGANYGDKTSIDFPKDGNIDALKKRVIEEVGLSVSAVKLAARAAADGDNEDPAEKVEELLKKCHGKPVVIVLLDLDEGR